MAEEAIHDGSALKLLAAMVKAGAAMSFMEAGAVWMPACHCI